MAYQGNNNHKGGRNNNRQNHHQEAKVEVQEILLDYELQSQLFGDIAQNWAKKIEKEKKESKDKLNKSSQIRRFYDVVLELNEKAQNKSSDEEYKKEVYPFVVMLNSKVAYAKSRDLVSDSFVKMINQCVTKSSDSRKKMNNFKLFFEALIGFYPKK